MNSRKLLLSILVAATAWGGLRADSGTNDSTAIAGDFTYAQASGVTATLHALTAPRVLVYFYDPTCEDCEALTRRLASSEPINRLIDEGRLQVLAIYPDNDRELWKSHASHLPGQWINGYDEHLSIIPGSNYLFHSLPALYLLDKEKYIRLRETTLEAIENAMRRIK